MHRTWCRPRGRCRRRPKSLRVWLRDAGRWSKCRWPRLGLECGVAGCPAAPIAGGAHERDPAGLALRRLHPFVPCRRDPPAVAAVARVWRSGGEHWQGWAASPHGPGAERTSGSRGRRAGRVAVAAAAEADADCRRTGRGRRPCRTDGAVAFAVAATCGGASDCGGRGCRRRDRPASWHRHYRDRDRALIGRVRGTRDSESCGPVAGCRSARALCADARRLVRTRGRCTPLRSRAGGPAGAATRGWLGISAVGDRCGRGFGVRARLHRHDLGSPRRRSATAVLGRTGVLRPVGTAPWTAAATGCGRPRRARAGSDGRGRAAASPSLLVLFASAAR